MDRKPEKQYWIDDPRNVTKIFHGLCAACAALIVPDLFVDKHAHFPYENWLGFSMGSSDNDLTLGGFYFESQFVDINDASTRQLERVTIGWTSVTGTISVEFNSFTGNIQGTEHYRQDLGPTTIHLHDEGFSMTLDVVDGISFAIGGP